MATRKTKPARKPRQKPVAEDRDDLTFSPEFLETNSARCTLHIMADRVRKIAMLRADEISGTALLRGLTSAAVLDSVADHAAAFIIPGYPALAVFVDATVADLLA